MELAKGGTDLAAAVDAAVADGLRALDDLTAQVMQAFDQIEAVSQAAETEHGARPDVDILARLTRLVREKKAEAETRLARQQTRLETFNLVLFGRTGAGKSSLIEALSGGDGQPISQGESDWTTDVRDVRWHRTRLFDTPGICGWGRTTSRRELEARAEAAVADADVVLLCFDSQSQQAGEFALIAEWVSRYGKPVVAVLNVRNLLWRAPHRVGSEWDRRNASRTVHDHVSNIRDELTMVGLPGVPVVAIHTQRATYARTKDPYAGPTPGSRRKQRDEHGPERLLAWSNLAALELLLTEALAQHAGPLRLGMLHEQAHALLADMGAAISVIGDQATTQAELIERGITDVLKLVGRPRERDLELELERLEVLRGGGFGTTGTSELLLRARNQLTTELWNTRVTAYRRADELIEDAFDTRRDLDPIRFHAEVIGPVRQAAELAFRKVAEEMQTYLWERLQLVADDLQAEMRVAGMEFRGVGAAAGQNARRAGVSIQYASAAINAGIGVVAIGAAVNWWNPAGWVLGALSAGGAVLTYAGGKVRSLGASSRLRSLTDARSRVRQGISEMFQELERAMGDECHRILAAAAHGQLSADVSRASALRRLAMTGSEAHELLDHAAEDLPNASDVSYLLADVAMELERRFYPGEPTADRLLWLGESWCTDPEGLTGTESARPVASVGEDHIASERLLTQIRSIIERAALVPAPGSGPDWVRATLEELAADAAATDAISPLEGLATSAVPAIVVAGDYSTGKSTFIKRLLIDAGQPVPDQLDVSARPRTEATAVFRWGGWELVDTPGFQSGHAGHNDVAHEGIIGSSLVIVLFNPNLVVGATDDLSAVLFGDRKNGRVGKLARTLFVVNRSDELGVDPREDPDGYRNLCHRKQRELVQALTALINDTSGEHATVRPDQVICVASDPYGAVGDRTEVDGTAYDAHRDWDGMDALHRALLDPSCDLGVNGADVQVLERGATALGTLIGQRRRDLTNLDALIAQRRHLLLDLDACLSAGRALQASARDQLATRFVGFVAGLFDDVSGTEDKATLEARVRRLEGWAADPELQEIHREWSANFDREIKEWEDATSTRIEARLNSAELLSVFAATGAVLDIDHLKPDGDFVVREKLVTGGSKAAAYAAEASRETVTKVAHAFGHKFRPWGATKLTAKVNVAGAALGVAFGTFEIYSTWRSAQRDGELERTANERRSAALRQVREATEAWFDRPDIDAPGASVTESLGQVEQVRHRQALLLDQDITEATILAARIEVCETQMRDALQRLEPAGS